MTPVQKRFVDFILEREAMRVRREIFGDPAPWSLDPIMASYRFCNVNREDDAVTRWIAQNVRPLLKTKNDAVVGMLLCRIFNEPETLKKFGWPPHIDSVVMELGYLRDNGHRLLRGAYMMPAHGDAGKGLNIEDYWMRVVREVKFGLDFMKVDTLREVAEKLMTIKGLGDFLANQVCADLRYMPQFKEAPDWETFVRCGPGTRRGLNRYAGVDPEDHKMQHLFIGQLYLLRKELLATTSMTRSFRTYFRDPNNLSNCFCEFDKYERAREQLAAGKSTTLRKYGTQKS